MLRVVLARRGRGDATALQGRGRARAADLRRADDLRRRRREPRHRARQGRRAPGRGGRRRPARRALPDQDGPRLGQRRVDVPAHALVREGRRRRRVVRAPWRPTRRRRPDREGLAPRAPMVRRPRAPRLAQVDARRSGRHLRGVRPHARRLEPRWGCNVRCSLRRPLLMRFILWCARETALRDVLFSSFVCISSAAAVYYYYS
mmetsp:Transcript_26777/g.107277  ORF Transcript_26777/g.107277 Transcript_26777/m.107277 type:complete len:203 (+) Transcript_26777:430-1038(+)